MAREIKSIIYDDTGRAYLLSTNNEKAKRAAGICVTSRCRNRLPSSATLHSNKHCSKCSMRVWRINSGHKAVMARLRERARERCIPFTLTLGQLAEIIGDSNYLVLKGRVRGLLHLDRIVPELGYVDGNVRVVSVTENVIKGNVERHTKPEPDFSWLDE